MLAGLPWENFWGLIMISSFPLFWDTQDYIDFCLYFQAELIKSWYVIVPASFPAVTTLTVVP